MEEVWVTFDAFPNYAVSNYGQVINVHRGRELKPRTDRYGYLSVCFSRDNIKHSFFVHRLVARAFFLNYQEGMAITHINGNRADNSVLNLTLTDKRCKKGEDVW